MRLRMIHLPGLAVGLVAGLLAGTIAAAPAATAAPGPAVPTINWQDCGADHPGFQCATVSVPLDYDQLRGATTTLALARKPATDTAHRIGTLFINPGGPGGSGVDLAFGVGDELSANLNGRFDILGFDPRGIGASDPIHCFASADDENAYLSGLPNFPYKAEQERPFFDKARGLGPQCRGQDGTIAAHMSTADVARDLDLLRRAVGDPKLNYLGFSYGTFIGNTYANLFPNNIRALVIDGVLDPALWSSGWQILSDRVNTLKEFNEMLRLCDAAGSACAFHNAQGAPARWEALANSVRANPIDLGNGTFYTYDMLINDAVGAMYSPETSWGGPDGFGAFLAQLADLVQGKQVVAASLVKARKAFHPAGGREADYPNGFDSFLGNICADTQFPSTFEADRAIGRFAEAGSRFGPLWWWLNAACADWPVNQDRYTGPWRTRTSAPVLVVGNFFDGVTSFDGAQASARNLAGSRLLAYAGWGHTAYGRNDCVTGHVDAYLLTGALPAAGTVCPANPNPFLRSLSITSAASPIGLPTWPMR